MDTLCVSGSQLTSIGTNGTLAPVTPRLGYYHEGDDEGDSEIEDPSHDSVSSRWSPEYLCGDTKDNRSSGSFGNIMKKSDNTRALGAAVLPDSSLGDGVSVSESGGLCWHGTQLATFCNQQRVFRCSLCTSTAFTARQMADHWLGVHANFKSFQCPRCPYMSSWQRCVRMHLVRHHNDRISEVVQFDNGQALLVVQDSLTTLKKLCERNTTSSVAPALNSASVERQENRSARTTIDEDGGGKRHHCPYCPYSTHRRDLFNRHENIHKSDKPFHCYICKKMFNRADHVKKHFMRIHREVVYDVKLIRRIPPKTLTAQVYYARAPTVPVTVTNKTVDSVAKDSNVNASTDSALSPASETTESSMPASFSSAGDSCGSEPALSPDDNPVHYDRKIHSCFSQSDHHKQACQEQIVKQEEKSELFCEIKNANCAGIHGHKIESSDGTVLDLPVGNIKQEISADAESDESHEHVQILAGGSPLVDTELTIDGRAEWRQRQDERQRRSQECFTCPQCPWRGFDNWCLKRHVNTHTRPYTCSLCPYKAARSERLSFHAAKVHHKRICVKCFFVCDRQETLNEHMMEKHDSGHSRQEYTCLTCACIFSSHEKLQTHMVVSHRRRILRCQRCSFSTTDPLVLDDHERYSHQPDCVLSVSSAPVNTISDRVITSAPSTSPPPLETPYCRQPTQHRQHKHSKPSQTRAGSNASCEQCRSTVWPLVCVHKGQMLSCMASQCHFKTDSASLLQQHVGTSHSDSQPRCPHCALSLRSPLELSVHWPTHHPAMCWSCVLLVQRHCTFVEPPVDASLTGQQICDVGNRKVFNDPEDRQGETDWCEQKKPGEANAPLDYSAFLSLQLTEAPGDVKLTEADGRQDDLQQAYSDYYVAEDLHADNSENFDGEALMKRSRKQSRPKRLLSDSESAVTATKVCARSDE